MGGGGAVAELRDLDREIGDNRLKATTNMWWLKPMDGQSKWNDHIPVRTLKYTGQHKGVRRDEFEWLQVKHANMEIRGTTKEQFYDYNYTRLRPCVSPPRGRGPASPLRTPRSRVPGGRTCKLPPGAIHTARAMEAAAAAKGERSSGAVTERSSLRGRWRGGGGEVDRALEAIMLESVITGRAAIAEDIRSGRTLTCRACLHPVAAAGGHSIKTREATSPVRPRLPSINLHSPYTPRNVVAENSVGVLMSEHSIPGPLWHELYKYNLQFYG